MRLLTSLITALVTATPGLAFAGFASIDVPEDCGALRAWHDRVAQRPSVAAA